MAPSLKTLQIQSEAEPHLLPGHYRGKMYFWTLRTLLKTLSKKYL